MSLRLQVPSTGQLSDPLTTRVEKGCLQPGTVGIPSEKPGPPRLLCISWPAVLQLLSTIPDTQPFLPAPSTAAFLGLPPPRLLLQCCLLFPPVEPVLYSATSRFYNFFQGYCVYNLLLQRYPLFHQ